MAGTPRTFSRGSHIEAKAEENIGQDKPPEDVTEKVKQTDQQKQISEVFTDSESEQLCATAWVVAPIAPYPFSRLRAA